MTETTMTTAVNGTSGSVSAAFPSKSIPIRKHDRDTIVDDKPLVNQNETKATTDENSILSGDTSSSAFCLLIKDDNDILSEWIAYHYHVFRMRRLIVAVDPTSETSPQPILDRWRDNFELDYTLWRDEDYAPDYFVERDYTKIPNSDGGIVIDISNNNNNSTSTQQTKNANYIADYLNHPIVKSRFHPKNEKFVATHQTQMRDDLIQINLHRFRQTNFVSECYRALKSEFSNNNNLSPWVVHIDTDEFLVPNPWIADQLYDDEQNNLLYHNNKNFQTEKGTTIGNHNPYPNRDFLESIFPQKPSEGSLWKLYQQFTTSQHWKESHAAFRTREQMGCVMMPRINFGSHEDNDDHQHVTIATTATNDETLQTIMATVIWNHNRFESLRWKYHTDFFSSKLPPKAIVDVDRLSRNDSIFVNQRIENLHHPLGENGCTPLEMDFINPYQPLEPLAVYHYMGSLKRYMTRESPLRTKRKYKFKNDGANYATGDQNIAVKDNNKNSQHNTNNRPARNNNESRWWMKGWLDSFVDTHGAAKVYTVLGKEYASKS